jgi:L-cysteine:1D-myo-inositol 2-amino-2-deoxy-alpha-D-glucopyranoside ligase
MQLYDSLTNSVQPLDAQGGELQLYVCGITPYDITHLGHAFTYCSVDVLVRLLEFQGRRVRYVQNVTDVDDDLLREARARDTDWRRLGDKWTARYIEDMTALNVRPPDRLPRASDVIPQIIEQVDNLIQAGVAYAAGGNVYFDLAAWPEYGRLSELSREVMLPIANERGNYSEDPHKRDPLDFVLWQAQAPGEPAWDSPWGAGRPGWHIECSTMAQEYLGSTIDLHAGGADLEFPHHESEVAQTESLTGEPLARSWMHIAMVELDGEKMSKSLGNLVLIRDLLDRWPPNAVRFYLASHHYREPWSHQEIELDQSRSMVEMLDRAVEVTGGLGPAFEPAADEAEFLTALEDDLNSPRAIEILLRLGDSILAAAAESREVEAAQRTLIELAGVLGLRLEDARPDASVVDGWRKHLQDFTQV